MSKQAVAKLKATAGSAQRDIPLGVGKTSLGVLDGRIQALDMCAAGIVAHIFIFACGAHHATANNTALVCPCDAKFSACIETLGDPVQVACCDAAPWRVIQECPMPLTHGARIRFGPSEVRLDLYGNAGALSVAPSVSRAGSLAKRGRSVLPASMSDAEDIPSPTADAERAPLISTPTRGRAGGPHAEQHAAAPFSDQTLDRTQPWRPLPTQTDIASTLAATMPWEPAHDLTQPPPAYPAGPALPPASVSPSAPTQSFAMNLGPSHGVGIAGTAPTQPFGVAPPQELMTGSTGSAASQLSTTGVAAGGAEPTARVLQLDEACDTDASTLAPRLPSAATLSTDGALKQLAATVQQAVDEDAETLPPEEVDLESPATRPSSRSGPAPLAMPAELAAMGGPATTPAASPAPCAQLSTESPLQPARTPTVLAAAEESSAPSQGGTSSALESPGNAGEPASAGPRGGDDDTDDDEAASDDTTLPAQAAPEEPAAFLESGATSVAASVASQQVSSTCQTAADGNKHDQLDTLSTPRICTTHSALTQKELSQAKKLHAVIEEKSAFRADVVVTSKYCRSLKVLQALCSGVPIVSDEWVANSIAAGAWLPHMIPEFEVRDAKAEALKAGCSLRTALQRWQAAQPDGILHGWSIWIGKHSGEPGLKDVGQLICKAGGTWLKRKPHKLVERTVVIAGEGDLRNLRAWAGPVYTMEALLVTLQRQAPYFEEDVLLRAAVEEPGSAPTTTTSVGKKRRRASARL